MTKSLSQLTHYPWQKGDHKDEEKGCGPAGLQVMTAKVSVAKSGRWKEEGVFCHVHMPGAFWVWVHPL